MSPLRKCTSKTTFCNLKENISQSFKEKYPQSIVYILEITCAIEWSEKKKVRQYVDEAIADPYSRKRTIVGTKLSFPINWFRSTKRRYNHKLHHIILFKAMKWANCNIIRLKRIKIPSKIVHLIYELAWHLQ